MNTLTKNKIFDVEPDRQTNWYVITGGPISGKTTTVNLLNSAWILKNGAKSMPGMDM